MDIHRREIREALTFIASTAASVFLGLLVMLTLATCLSTLDAYLTRSTISFRSGSVAMENAALSRPALERVR